MSSPSLFQPDEAQRLSVLRGYEILDTPPEQSFDDITKLASQICEAPIALISLVEEHRQWFKSKVGLQASETPREVSFCAHALHQQDIFLVEDATKDPRFAQNSLVTSAPEIRFYAGKPLISQTGFALGTLCVIDRVPRKLTPFQIEALNILGRQVMTQIELRHLIQESEKDREFHNILLDSLREGVAVCDASGRLTRFNHSMQEILGLAETSMPPEEWAEHYSVFRLDGSHMETKELPLVRALAGETVRDAELVIAPLKRPRRVLLANGRPIFNRAGKKLGAFVVTHDITESKRYEEELSRARDLALESVRLKADFLANMSHEIRTPMNGIIGMTNLLSDTNLTDEQRSFTDAISTCAESLLTIINDILDFSKIDAGKLAFEIIDFDLRDMVDGVLEVLAPRAHAKNLELICSFAPDLPFLLQGDPGRLRQILNNLVGNAIKFTEKGEVVVRVNKEIETDQVVTIRFEIQDSGVGIPVEAQGRIFQAFTQADSSTVRKYGGTGLGLAISRQLVTLMGGEIGFESVPDKGTLFWFEVPLPRQTAPAVRTIMPQMPRGIRLLVVDDNAINRDVLRLQTANWGFASEAVSDAEEALRYLKNAVNKGIAFRVALLDFQMPGMDGIELAKKIKADPALAQTHLILCSSVGHYLDKSEQEAAGLGACLIKPLKHSQLFDCLSGILLPRTATSTKSPEKVSAEPASKNMRVLLAEDNLVNQRVAKAQLQKLGYSVEIANNGEEAIQASATNDYHFILMDCQMPDMDGYEATRRIRVREQKSARKSAVIIALTANAMQGARDKCLAAGMNDYLSKPFHAEVLRTVLERWETDAKASPPAAPPSAPEEQLINIPRLHEMTDGNPEEIRSLLELYLDLTAQSLTKLRDGIQQGNARQVEQVAHSCAGSSATCGVDIMVEPLKEMEALGEAKTLGTALPLLEKICARFEQVKTFTKKYLEK